jgi:hypothetical protein
VSLRPLGPFNRQGQLQQYVLVPSLPPVLRALVRRPDFTVASGKIRIRACKPSSILASLLELLCARLRLLPLSSTLLPLEMRLTWRETRMAAETSIHPALCGATLPSAHQSISSGRKVLSAICRNSRNEGQRPYLWRLVCDDLEHHRSESDSRC